MTIPVEITFFEVSPEITYHKQKGHMIRLAYRLDDVPSELLDSPIGKYFDFVEDIVFRMEWKAFVDNDWILLKSREVSAFPTERFRLESNNLRRAKCFLSRTDLVWDDNFFEAAELFCRISLAPILAATRRSIPAEAGKTYKLLASESGSELEYNQAQHGKEF